MMLVFSIVPRMQTMMHVMIEMVGHSGLQDTGKIYNCSHDPDQQTLRPGILLM